MSFTISTARQSLMIPFGRAVSRALTKSVMSAVSETPERSMVLFVVETSECLIMALPLFFSFCCRIERLKKPESGATGAANPLQEIPSIAGRACAEGIPLQVLRRVSERDQRYDRL